MLDRLVKKKKSGKSNETSSVPVLNQQSLKHLGSRPKWDSSTLKSDPKQALKKKKKEKKENTRDL